jgi:hypothetical protein
MALTKIPRIKMSPLKLVTIFRFSPPFCDGAEMVLPAWEVSGDADS